LEDQRLEEELVIHIDNLKKEATDLFDQEKYRECKCSNSCGELEPKNRTLQDYLEPVRRRSKRLKTRKGGPAEPQSQNACPTVEAAQPQFRLNEPGRAPYRGSNGGR
jgi:hypothetical protein